MPRFLIELPHADGGEGCLRALDAIVNSGSHLVTHAEFGCSDGVHTGWLIAEMESREQARSMVPPQFRADAKIVQLRKWTPEEIGAMIADLKR